METSGPLINYRAYLAVFLLLGFPSIFFVSFQSVTTGDVFVYLIFFLNSFIWAGLVMGAWVLHIKNVDLKEKLRNKELNERVEKARKSLSRSKKVIKIPIHKKSL